MADHVHHTIDYVELRAPDLEPARSFYEDAFGWSFNDYGPDYIGIRRGDDEAGGIARADDPAPPLVILYSDDLDASLASVEAAGGVITQPPYAFPGGRRFHFTDPAGNHLAVWATS